MDSKSYTITPNTSLTEGIYDLQKKNQGEALIPCTFIRDDSRLPNALKYSENKDELVYILGDKDTLTVDHNGELISVDGDLPSLKQIYKGWYIPYPLFHIGFPFPLKLEKLWANGDIGVQELPISQLDWNLSFNWWEDETSERYSVSPKQVMDDLAQYKSYKERIENSDLIYPLTCIRTREGKLLIYDGLHRYVKTILNSYETVKVQIYQYNELDDFIPESHLDRYRRW